MRCRAVLALSGLLAVSWGLPRTAAAQDGGRAVESCVTCHSQLGGSFAAPVDSFPEDVHARKGFGCVSCHGGNGTDPGLTAMDPEEGFVGKPERADVPLLCGRCHSDATFMKRFNPTLRVDQVPEYLTSVHGRRLMEAGDENVATCVSCHPAHSIRPPTDPKSSVHPLRIADLCGSCHADSTRMAAYGIPTDQREQYETSVHHRLLAEDGDLSAPTCNDCHGNHGAAPPGVSWVGNVCGQCHALMADLFAGSRHAETFTFLGLPGCVTCHGNHAVAVTGDTLLGAADGAVCNRCHTEADAGGAAADEMRALIDSLRVRLDTATALLGRAENAGMEVSAAQVDLSGAADALIKSRTAVHAFDPEAVRREVEPGLEAAETGVVRGREALHDLWIRRVGLGVSVAIILVLIVGLVLKLRQIERST